MSEKELTREQKHAVCLAVMYAVEKAFRGDRERAFSIVDNSVYPERVKQQQIVTEQVTDWAAFGLQLLGKLFLRDDTPVYLPEKRTSVSAAASAKEECEALKADLDIYYQAMLMYLDHIIRRMRTGDVSIERCYNMLKQVADFQEGAIKTLRQIGINEQIHVSSSVDWCVERDENNDKARRRYQLIVRDAFYQCKLPQSTLPIGHKREKALAALGCIVSILQDQEKVVLYREKKSLQQTVVQRFDDTYAMLKEVKNEVKQSDSAADICYATMIRVASGKVEAASALLSMAMEMELFIRSTIRKLMMSLGGNEQMMADMRDGIHDICYPTE